MMKRFCYVACLLVAACGGDDWQARDETEEDPPVDNKPVCELNVTGRLTIGNSGTEVMTAELNSVSYGQINTGSTIAVDLPPGEYKVVIRYLSGAEACQAATAIVSVCSTQSLYCAG